MVHSRDQSRIDDQSGVRYTYGPAGRVSALTCFHVVQCIRDNRHADEVGHASAKRGGDTVYAVIETGGKQYRVAAGDTIDVERLPDDAGSQVEIERVLMVAGDEGITIGAPIVSGAAVVATITEHLRGPKIVVFKFKPKKRYRRKTGHRQELTRLKIDSIRTA
jgi:large subunit ribosomal protein L21